MSLFAELKRRNVLRVGAGYAVAAWLLIQVAETVFPLFGFDDTPARVVVIVLAIGFIPVLVLAWVFQFTAAGIRVDAEAVDAPAAIPTRRFDRAVMLVLLVAVTYFAVDKFLLAPSKQAATLALSQPSIAVLPFDDMSPAGDQEYFSDGIAESLLDLLAQFRSMKVAARTSSFAFKEQNLSIEEIAEQLNVDYVLEGSVRRAGDTVRITAQLIEAAGGFHVWSETFDRPLQDVFAVQDEIAGIVAESLKVTLHGEPPRAEVRSPEAYTTYLQAIHLHRQFNEQSLRQAIGLYEKVLSLDADYVDAWANIGSAYSNLAGMDAMPKQEGYKKAREAAENALVLEPTNAKVFDQLGWIALNYDNDLPRAVQFYEKALTLDPTAPGTLGNGGVLAMAIGRIDQAIALMEYHTTLDPVSAIAFNNLSNGYYLAQRFADQEQAIRTALSLSTDLWGGQYRLGKALLFQRQFEAALEAFMAESTDDEYRIKGIALAAFALGRHDEADDALQQMIEGWGEQYPDEVAQVYAYRGERDAAFAWLAKMEDPSAGAAVLRLEPLFGNLLDDARWPAVLAKHGASDDTFAGYRFRTPELPVGQAAEPALLSL